MENTVFEVTVVLDWNRNRPHYPSYDVHTTQVGIASSLVEAEKLISKFIALGCHNNIHHFNIEEKPLDSFFYINERLSEWLYDRNGNLLDKRLFSNIENGSGRFIGRTPEEVRFKEGDIVEVLECDSITLGFVFRLPPSVEMAAKYNNSPFYMDDTDDSYVILYNEDSSYDFHISSLMVFKPEFKIHPAVEKRLRTAYQHSLTFEMRTRIAMTTAIERIRQTVDELGMSCDVEAYYFLFVHVTHHKDNGNKTLIRIDAQKAFNHIERVLLTLRRYAGHPIPGRRGYSLSLFDGPSSKSATFEDYEMK